MTIMTENKLASAIESIGKSLATWRDEVQEVLISCAYQAARGNDYHANKLLSVISDGKNSAVNVSGVTRWLETYAPLVIKNGVFVINKGMRKSMNVESESDFVQFEVEMRKISWWLIGKSQAAESIYDVSEATINGIERIAKKQESEGFSALAAETRALLKVLRTTKAWQECAGETNVSKTATQIKAEEAARLATYNLEAKKKAAAAKAAATREAKKKAAAAATWEAKKKAAAAESAELAAVTLSIAADSAAAGERLIAAM